MCSHLTKYIACMFDEHVLLLFVQVFCNDRRKNTHPYTTYTHTLHTVLFYLALIPYQMLFKKNLLQFLSEIIHLTLVVDSIIFEKSAYSSSLPIFKLGYLLLLKQQMLFIYSGYKSFIRYMIHFSHFVTCLHFLILSFNTQKLFNLMNSNLSIFLFHLQVSFLKKFICKIQNSEDLLLCFFQEFMILVLIFRPLIPFELILYLV